MSAPGPGIRAAYGRGAAAGLAGRGLETVCGLVQLWLLTRILDGAEFGRFVFAMAVVQVLAVIGSGGFERLTVFRLSRTDAPPGELAGAGFAGALLGWAIVFSGGLAVVAWAAAPALAALLGEPRLLTWLRALVWLIPVIAAAETYAAWHLARHRFARAVLLGRGAPAVAVTAGLVIVWSTGLGAAGVAIAFIAGRALVAFAWWLTRPVNPLRGGGRLGAADARYAAQTAGVGLVHRALRQCDLLMLLPLAGPVVTAHYAVVSRFAWLLRSGHELLGPIFTSRAGSLLHAGDAPAVCREFHVNRAWATIVALLLAAPLVLFGQAILDRFGGAGAAYPALLVLLGDQVAFVAFGLSGLLLMVAGRGGWALSTNLVMLAANVALNLALIPAFGAAGAAIATLAGGLFAKSLTALMLWKLDRLATLRVDTALLAAIALAALLLGAAGLLAAPMPAAVCATIAVLLLLEQRPAVRAALGLPAPARDAAPAHPGGWRT